MRREAGLQSREVACLRESLSEQDLESVGGASGREGLRRTTPSREKWLRPRREVAGVGREGGDGEREGGRAIGGEERGRAQGVGSSWAAMVSSMLASPPGRVSLMDVWLWI
jgi:hypothetical protein